MPSGFNALAWEVTLSDIRFKLKVVHSQKEAELLQHYEILTKVVSQVFGGSESASKPQAKPTETFEEAVSQIAAIFG